ncbi:helix-turn-helix domain-containing protein [Fulvivirga sp.]|uniref:helix-turn-helix domain-containing protein n=1 Tax=Fulvivirga sp. TaxID=1931237 RepID=UPI0032EEA139
MQKSNRLKPFTSLVRKQILKSFRFKNPTLNQIANQLCLSNRSLQRRLSQEGMTYRKLLSQVKMELSKTLEIQCKYKTKDVAYALGYCSSSSYLHAKNRWRRLRITQKRKYTLNISLKHEFEPAHSDFSFKPLKI